MRVQVSTVGQCSQTRYVCVCVFVWWLAVSLLCWCSRIHCSLSRHLRLCVSASNIECLLTHVCPGRAITDDPKETRVLSVFLCLSEPFLSVCEQIHVVPKKGFFQRAETDRCCVSMFLCAFACSRSLSLRMRGYQSVRRMSLCVAEPCSSSLCLSPTFTMCDRALYESYRIYGQNKNHPK